MIPLKENVCPQRAEVLEQLCVSRKFGSADFTATFYCFVERNNIDLFQFKAKARSTVRGACFLLYFRIFVILSKIRRVNVAAFVQQLDSREVWDFPNSQKTILYCSNQSVKTFWQVLDFMKASINHQYTSVPIREEQPRTFRC